MQDIPREDVRWSTDIEGCTGRSASTYTLLMVKDALYDFDMTRHGQVLHVHKRIKADYPFQRCPESVDGMWGILVS